MKRLDAVLSHWHTYRDNFSTPIEPFYDRVKAAIEERNASNISFRRHTFYEGGFTSGKRLYLRVERKHVAFDICAAPYGRGFFFSWWLVKLGPKHPVVVLLGTLFGVGLISWLIAGSFTNSFPWLITFPLTLLAFFGLVRAKVIGTEEGMLEVPILGWLYGVLFNPVTYFSLDTAIMFQEMVHSALLEAVDELSISGGMRTLTEGERKPVLTEFLDRR